jgi:hypothetical protein
MGLGIFEGKLFKSGKYKNIKNHPKVLTKSLFPCKIIIVVAEG